MRLDDRDELGPRARAAREPDPEVELRDAQRDVVDVGDIGLIAKTFARDATIGRSSPYFLAKADLSNASALSNRSLPMSQMTSMTRLPLDLT